VLSSLVRGVALVGSWARRTARPDSDLDLVVLVQDITQFSAARRWADLVPRGFEFLGTQEWGPLTERRVRLVSGLQVELGIAPLSWAVTKPADDGTVALSPKEWSRSTILMDCLLPRSPLSEETL
jgi:hypothetical protein